jgi:hypothetical protein
LISRKILFLNIFGSDSGWQAMGMLERCQRGGTVEDMPLNLVLGDWQVAIPHLPCRKAAGEQARKGLQSIQDVVPPPPFPGFFPALPIQRWSMTMMVGGRRRARTKERIFYYCQLFSKKLQVEFLTSNA